MWTKPEKIEIADVIRIDCPEWFERGPEAVRKYHFLNSFRPWWASQRYLRPEQRPVALGVTLLLLLAVAAVGAVGMALGLWASPRKSSACALESQSNGAPEPLAAQK